MVANPSGVKIMGRKPTVNLHLPPNMRAKQWSSGKVYYYLDQGVQRDGRRKWLPLGCDFPDALRKYAEQVETMPGPAVTVPELLTRWNVETAPGRTKGTLDDIRWALPHLISFFSTPAPAPLIDVEPVHITQYLAWRVKATIAEKTRANERRISEGKAPLDVKHNAGAVRANREIAWLSAAWNWGRSVGLTRAQNPCGGVRRNKETGRDTYIEDDEMAAIMAHASTPLKEAIDLAYLVGQRPCDLRAFKETDIRGGYLHVSQQKTGAKGRIEVVGALDDLIQRIRARKAGISGVRSLSLLVNESGQPLTKSAMRYQFDKAREAASKAAQSAETAKRIMSLQFRDLRAKSATDKADANSLRDAQSLMMHTSQGMTEHYVRKRKGAKITPVK